MKNSVRIPIALQIVLDDFGWMNGKNELSEGRPARTGINRNHCPNDVTVLNEIGKQTGMKLVCGFTIGEWDKDNVLRGMKHATWDEKGWDRASEIDYDLAKKLFDEIEKSENIELAFHGLMHGYWVNGENYGSSREFFYYDIPEDTKERKNSGYPLKPVPASYVEEHLDAYFKIYNSWGFSQKIRTFIMPASVYKDKEIVLGYASVAEKYGMKYWKNYWADYDGAVTMLNSIVFLNTSGNIPWDKIDFEPESHPDRVFYNPDDFDKLHGYIILGAHWPNFLSSDPSKNMDNVNKWVNYLNRQKEIFGFMLSKDIAFAASQALYHKFLKLDFTENQCILDASEVDKQNAPELSKDIYISIKNDKQIKDCVGADFEIYEVHNEFTTYKLTRKDKNLIKLIF